MDSEKNNVPIGLPPDFFVASVGQLIRQAREEAGFNQAQLAEQIHRRQASLSEMENGKMQPDATTLMRLAIALKKPVSYFFPPWFRDMAGPEGENEDERRLLKAFRQLNSRHYQRIAVHQVEALAKFVEDEWRREMAIEAELESDTPDRGYARLPKDAVMSDRRFSDSEDDPS